ncbi:hypothetical protein [Nocardioides dilutus]
MPKSRSSSGVLVAAALLLATTGCSLFSDDPDGPDESSSSPSGVTITEAPPDALAGIESALDRRADAVRRGDERRFLAGLANGDQADPGLRDQQRTYFANLSQLPLAAFDYSVDPAGLVRDGEDYWVVVELSLQLDGFDTAPVRSRDRFRFTPGTEPGRYRLASVTDPQWEVDNEVQPQPWDDGEIVAVRDTGVLGIFDSGSVRASAKLLASVQRGIAEVAGVVPSSWTQSVVVYALSNTAFLATLPGLPGGDPTILDGVAFPVFASPDGADGEGGAELVGTRFVLHPRMLDEAGRARDRLVRHELTHVAIGEADDRAPVWLSEGLAEYVSVQSLPPERRTISGAAIDAARAGVTEMPPDDAFNDAGTPGRASANYGIAWFACEYLAASYGEVTLWQLLDALDQEDADPDEVLLAQLGLNVRTLARKAGKLILTTYDAPEPEPTPEPTPTAQPTGVPTDLPAEQPSAVPPDQAG